MKEGGHMPLCRWACYGDSHQVRDNFLKMGVRKKREAGGEEGSAKEEEREQHTTYGGGGKRIDSVRGDKVQAASEVADGEKRGEGESTTFRSKLDDKPKKFNLKGELIQLHLGIGEQQGGQGRINAPLKTLFVQATEKKAEVTRGARRRLKSLTSANNQPGAGEQRGEKREERMLVLHSTKFWK